VVPVDNIKGIIALAITSLFSAGSLAVVYDKTFDKIVENQRQFERNAVKNIFQSAHQIEERKIEDVLKYFEVSGEDGELVGYAIVGNGGGYQGNIGVLIGVTADFEECVGIDIVDSNETPGLGAKIQTEEWRAQFRGMDLTKELGVVKSGAKSEAGEIDAISGATISSKAVAGIINGTVGTAKELIRASGVGKGG
jgi:electron transport complex protein RnfG